MLPTAPSRRRPAVPRVYCRPMRSPRPPATPRPETADGPDPAAPVEWVVDGHLSVTALDDMCASSGLQRAEVFALWARFRALCRLCGRADDVTEAMFRRSVPLLLMEDDTFCHRLFEVCASQYGAMNWRAFLTVIGLLTRGDRESRVRLLFKVYDRGGRGLVTVEDFYALFSASLRLLRNSKPHKISRMYFLDVFRAIDVAGRGTVSEDDVLQYLQRHPKSDDGFGLFGRFVSFASSPLPDVYGIRTLSVK